MNENPYKLPADQFWSNRILFRTEVGSTAHGTGIDGQEDYDEIGIIYETFSEITALNPIEDNYLWRPGRKPTERSRPGDWDLMLYTARKWCRLAVAGNPSILVSLFGPRVQTTAEGLSLLDNHKWFWSEQARPRFLGYAKSQRERLMGVRGGKHTNRPELIEKYGFDTKYAMHMLRLGFQGIEYMHTGKLVLPMNDERGDYLRAVRLGEIKLEDVLCMAEINEDNLKHLTSDAPEKPDYNAVNKWLAQLAKNHQ